MAETNSVAVEYSMSQTLTGLHHHLKSGVAELADYPEVTSAHQLGVSLHTLRRNRNVSHVTL